MQICLGTAYALDTLNAQVPESLSTEGAFPQFRQPINVQEASPRESLSCSLFLLVAPNALFSPGGSKSAALS